MRPPVRLEITILSFTMLLPDPLSQQKHYEILYSTQTGRDNLLFTNLIDSLFSFFTVYGWKQEDIYLQIISVFSVYSQSGIVQISDVLLLLFSKTNARARQDL